MRYRLTAAASTDIERILRYSRQEYGAKQARKYHSGLRNAFRYLVANPFAARERSEVQPPVRIYPYRAHLVIYVVEASGILIVRVQHGSQDWQGESR